KDGSWSGDMFDGKGCVRGLKDQGDDPKGRDALLVGCGGAGSAVGCGLGGAGGERLTLFDTDRAQAERPAATIKPGYPGVAVALGAPDPSGHNLAVNCTPLGMKPDDKLPLEADKLTPSTVVVDVVIKAEPTKLLAAAASRGCHHMGGLSMLRGQSLE